jgi:uncharacterized protein with beta-barrel porin domain
MTIIYIFLNLISAFFTATLASQQAVNTSFNNYQKSVNRTIVQEIAVSAESYYTENAKYPEFDEIDIENEDGYAITEGLIMIGDPATREARLAEDMFCYDTTGDTYSVGVDTDEDGQIDFKLGNSSNLCKEPNI